MYFSLEVKSRREDFYDMESELERLKKELKDPLTRMIVIKGIRRVGKSSLLRVALSEVGLPYILVDLRLGGPFAPDDLYRYLTEEISRLIREHRTLASILSRVRGVEVAGFRVELSERKISVLGHVLRALSEWASDEGKQVVIAFDEAQDLRMIRGFDRLLAHVYDYERGLKILLAGSEVGLLDKLLGMENPEAPLFGRAYSEIVVSRLTEDRARDFLSKGFKQVGIDVTEEEISEAVSRLDGIIGWLTFYGYYRTRIEHREAIKRTLDEGSRLAASEIANFLANRQVARRRYAEVLRTLIHPSRWMEIKRSLRISIGVEVSDKQVSRYLKELIDYGFVVKEGGLYCIADPLLVEAIRRGYIR